MTDYDKDGVAVYQTIELTNSIRVMIENKQIYVKQIRFMAEMRAEKYLSLVTQGFSKEEALCLVKETPLFM